MVARLGLAAGNTPRQKVNFAPSDIGQVAFDKTYY